MPSSTNMGLYALVSLQCLVLLWTSSTVTANKHYCGPVLVNTLSLICEKFPDLNVKKKSAHPFDSDEWMMNMDDEQTSLDQQLQTVGDDTANMKHYPIWMNMLYPNDYMYGHSTGLIPPRFRKSNRYGIVDECCKNACSYYQLIQYCEKPVQL